MLQKKSTAIDVKRQNRQEVLYYIFQHENCSRQDIAAALGMSMPTVLTNVKELSKLGLVTETGQYDSTGGRKAAVISSVPQAKLAIGIDITRNHISMVLVDLAGNILEQMRFTLTYENTIEYYNKLEDLANNFINKTEDIKDRFLGYGISIPGIINENGNVITDSHALGIKNISCNIFMNNLEENSIFINDANAAGFAEAIGKEQNRTLVYLSLSNSVGGAVFIGGKLYTGSNQRSGEFGHSRLIPGGRRCYCGQEGCMDAYLNALQLSGLENGRLEDFFQKLLQGDLFYEKTWSEYLSNLAVAVINLRMVFDCDIILGGYVGAWMEPYLPELKKLVKKLDTFEDNADYIQLCKYKREASAFGAAMQHVYQYLENIS